MRAFMIALALVALSGCGFKPMLAPGPSGVAIGPVRLPEISGKSGHALRTELERLLDAERGQGPLRSLEVALSERVVLLGLRVDESATRADLVLIADYEFFDEAGQKLFSGRVDSVASYDIPLSAFGELAAQNDARERAAQSLAEKMRLELALRLANTRGTP